MPSRGIVFWPVGNGDSTTFAVEKGVTIQIDLNNLYEAEDEDNPHIPVIEGLIEQLPKMDGKPYLSVFVLTHPDQDHCRGFAELLDQVKIGELWFAPRVFREYSRDLSEDAICFKKEAKRRVKATIDKNGNVPSGDRVRIIGYDDLLKEEEYCGFPLSQLTVPGNEVTKLDGKNYDGIFRAFVHAPFKDDSAGERNETSIALQITLYEGQTTLQALLFGDLAYPTLKKIFDLSKENDLSWNVMLAPHHCSKSAMYWQEEDEEEEKRKDDILNDMGNAAADSAYIISSSEPIPDSNEPGDNPPHAIARNRYQEIVSDGCFICTEEYPSEDNPEPLVFELGESGIIVPGHGNDRSKKTSVTAAVAVARGGNEPPEKRIGFGKKYD